MAWNSDGTRTVRCRKCWGKGHNIRNCPTLSPEQKAEYATGDRARKCSWCAKTGHNKNGCVSRKTDRIAYITANSLYRKKVLDFLTSKGYGVGALVTSDRHEALDTDKLYFITDINWDEIQQKRPGAYIFKATHIGCENTNELKLPPFDELTERSYYSNWYTANIVSPAKGVALDPPAGWLDGASNIDQFF